MSKRYELPEGLYFYFLSMDRKYPYKGDERQKIKAQDPALQFRNKWSSIAQYSKVSALHLSTVLYKVSEHLNLDNKNRLSTGLKKDKYYQLAWGLQSYVRENIDIIENQAFDILNLPPKSLEHFDGRGIANTLLAFKNFRMVPSQKLIGKLEERLIYMLRRQDQAFQNPCFSLSNRDVSNILYAYACLRIKPSKTFLKELEIYIKNNCNQDKNPDAQNVTMTLWSAAVLNSLGVETTPIANHIFNTFPLDNFADSCLYIDIDQYQSARLWFNPASQKNIRIKHDKNTGSITEEKLLAKLKKAKVHAGTGRYIETLDKQFDLCLSAYGSNHPIDTEFDGKAWHTLYRKNSETGSVERIGPDGSTLFHTHLLLKTGRSKTIIRLPQRVTQNLLYNDNGHENGQNRITLKHDKTLWDYPKETEEVIWTDRNLGLQDIWIQASLIRNKLHIQWKQAMNESDPQKAAQMMAEIAKNAAYEVTEDPDLPGIYGLKPLAFECVGPACEAA